MWFRGDAAKDGAVLKDFSAVVMKARGTLHEGLWNTISMDFSVSNIYKVLKVVWKGLKEHTDGSSVRISKDA